MTGEHENLDISIREVDGRIVENLSPSLIIALTDEISTEVLKEKSDGMVGIVCENVQEHQLAIDDYKRQQIDILTDSEYGV